MAPTPSGTSKSTGPAVTSAHSAELVDAPPLSRSSFSQVALRTPSSSIFRSTSSTLLITSTSLPMVSVRLSPAVGPDGVESRWLALCIVIRAVPVAEVLSVHAPRAVESAITPSR